MHARTYIFRSTYVDTVTEMPYKYLLDEFDLPSFSDHLLGMTIRERGEPLSQTETWLEVVRR